MQKMTPINWILIGLIVVMTIIGFFFLFNNKNDNQSSTGKKSKNDIVAPLKIQAYERLPSVAELGQHACDGLSLIGPFFKNKPAHA